MIRKYFIYLRVMKQYLPKSWLSWLQVKTVLSNFYTLICDLAILSNMYLLLSFFLRPKPQQLCTTQFFTKTIHCIVIHVHFYPFSFNIISSRSRTHLRMSCSVTHENTPSFLTKTDPGDGRKLRTYELTLSGFSTNN